MLGEKYASPKLLASGTLEELLASSPDFASLFARYHKPGKITQKEKPVTKERYTASWNRSVN